MTERDGQHVPDAHEIETFSGRFVNVDKPDPATFALDDIAHALSQICRYGGHCKTFYSVAEHAVFVSKRLKRRYPGNRPLQYAGLHHDDSEAFLGDIPRPIKPLLGAVYAEMTDAVDLALCEALNVATAKSNMLLLPEDFHNIAVKTADSWALFVEARHLLPSEGRLWWHGAQGADAWGLEEMPSRIVTPDYFKGGLLPAEARDLFIARHEELTCHA